MTSTSTVSQTYKSVGALRLVIQHGAFEESCLPFIVNWDLSPPVLTSRKRRKHITFLLHTQETYSPEIVREHARRFPAESALLLLKDSALCVHHIISTHPHLPQPKYQSNCITPSKGTI